ncbi:MAG: hypothetical protein IAE91_10910 [Ignavibacteriaceae bacterium]|nr:hypothetical protein [Ignavibacteriaceae bacterium]
MLRTKVDREEIVKKILELLTKATGLRDFGNDSKKITSFFESRLTEKKIASLEKYFELLENNTSNSKDEIKIIAEHFSNTETFFFRDHGQMNFLKNEILPSIISKNNPGDNINIWCAACSTGEEPYTIAIIISMLMQQNELSRVNIFGTDINIKALEKAKSGIYSQWSFRGVESSIIDKYFVKKGYSFELRDNIKQMVKFSFNNLAEGLPEEKFFQKSSFDLIICRNVFIYLTETVIDGAVNNFVEYLKPGGFLLTGHSELSGKKYNSLIIKQGVDSFIYLKQKDNDISEQKPVTPAIEHVILQPDLQKKYKPAKEIPKVEKRAVAEDRNVNIHSVKNSKNDSSININNLVLSYIEREDLINLSKIVYNLEFKDKDSEDILQKAATILADRGYSGAARFCCEKIIEIDPLNIKGYYILANLENESGNIAKSELLYNKILYLDYKYFAASIELAAIYEYQKRPDKSEKLIQNALKLLLKLDAESEAAPYKNVTVSQLISELKIKLNNR